MDPIETITISDCQAGSRWPKGVAITRSSRAIAATFGAMAKNAVTGVGAP